MARDARQHAVRIIGGRWRNTRIAVADREQLRPSADRVRETLFNWLAPTLPGARCLDLFAGSGALGFEALSRGAAHCVLVERDPALVAALAALKRRLDAADAELHAGDALRYLDGAPTPCDIVFLDPPFHQDLVPRALASLARGWLAPGALVYVEREREAAFEFGTFSVHRSGHTQQVQYALLRAPG